MDISTSTNPVFEHKKYSDQMIDQKVYDFVQRLKFSLQLTDSALSEILRLSQSEYNKVLDRRKNLDLLQMHRLCDHFNFTLKSVLDDQIDLQCLKQHYLKNYHYIPEKYTYCAFSKKRLIHTVSDYVGKFYHWSIQEDLLRYFQIQSIPSADADAPINVYLFENILAYLRNSGFSLTQIRNIGKYSIHTSKNTVFEKNLSKFDTPKSMFEYYFDEMIFFIEKNNRYLIISIDENSCEIESKEDPDLLEAFQVKHIAGINRCIYRQGALSAVTRYIGYADSIVTETTCSHRGDSTCRFHIQFRGKGYSHL